MTKAERIKRDEFYRMLPDHTLALLLSRPAKDATEKAIQKIARDEQNKRADAMTASFLSDLDF
jgi:hypothetical protein